jgi:hypothetical protein
VNARRLRLAAYGVFLGVLGPTLATAAGWLEPGDPRLPWIFAACATLGVGALLLAARRWRRPSGRALRALDLVAFNLLLALAAGEVAFRALQRFAPSQVLWDESSAAASVLALRQCEPPLHFPYRCNARSYPDEEFVEPGPGDHAVALLADSFGAGSVPWAFNFATLAERELRARLGGRFERVAIDDFGVNGANLPEYRWLFETEIRGRDYAQVVLCFFVGNDLEDSQEPGRTRRPGDLIRLQGWLAPEVARRIFAVARGVEQLSATPGAALEDEPAFLRDPALEPPFFTEDEFLSVESGRMRFTLARSPRLERLYERAFRILDGLHAELGPRLLVVVIPDEFQVSDAVWQAALDRAVRQWTALPLEQGRASFDRELPQKKLAGWAAARGARLLDLLPALREAEREGRTYHRRDTHWNARGNAVAAHELARALLAHVEAVPAGAALVEPGDPRHPPGARAAAGEGGSGR